MQKLDGNVAGGVLRTIFPFEMTTVEGVCAACGERRILATAIVYKTGMGTILRCPSCDAVLMRIAELEGHHCLDMRGLRVLRL
ncbi:MAG: hypothetical protein HOV80_21250 [Polyangiaceae bacterium]|nr:hypothetical protein [Polyangiaceae bacterium]